MRNLTLPASVVKVRRFSAAKAPRILRGFSPGGRFHHKASPNPRPAISLTSMAFLDDVPERHRLKRVYAAMTDGELQNLARAPESLTETAWDALEDELDRRDLEIEDEEDAQEEEPREELALQNLITIRQFRDLPEALLAKGSLESTGIECFLRDDNLVRLDWFISNFIGGIKLCVRPADVINAQNLLDQPILEGMYVHGVGLYEQPRCPKCQSLDINFQEIDRPIAFLSAFLRVPIPAQLPAWRCHSCNAEWDEDPSETGASPNA